MGATASRSSKSNTGKTTGLVRISEYSNLVRVPVDEPETFRAIRFNNLLWQVTVKPMCFNEGLADFINVAVVLGDGLKYRPDLVLKGIDISIEILDETEENTVFHKKSNVTTLQVSRRLKLVVFRRELEASSCVHSDSFTVRYTLSKQQATKWWCPFYEPKKLAAALEPQVAMAGSHMLTIGSFSNLKAALRNGECTYSTHFAVAGCRWYFQFCPAGIIGLVRASDDTTPTKAEFSFELQGVVNFESGKMTHTFEYASSRYIYRFGLEPSTSAMDDDPLIVRCRIAVIMAEKPSLPPAAIQTATTPRTVIMAEKPSLPPAAIQTATTQRTETIPTPLLNAMYD